MSALWLLCVASLLWLGVLLHLLRGLRHMAWLSPEGAQSAQMGALPSISVICVVKDEERLVGATVANLLAVGSPLDEVVVVDDRSTDRTPQILAELARNHPRLRVVRVDVLPEDWQGRVHALSVGAKHITGEFLLTVDAEIAIDPAVLAEVAALLRDRKLDHLAVLPQLHRKAFLLDVLLTTALVFYVGSQRPWMSIETRPVRSVRGVGAFNLVRRSFLETTPGFEALRMEIIDDVGLAQLIAHHGGRSQLVYANVRGPTFHWYRTVREMTLRLEKTIVGAFANYSLLLAIWITALSCSCVLLPLIALLFLPHPLALAALASFVTATLAWSLAASKLLPRRPLVLAFLPLGIALMGTILLRAALLCHVRGGILWKDTLYPVAALRKHRRTAFHV
jgi:cellulose synthase/poly-beta-1,6-N-acetylglucosamine synthase-like glycosyltransferase